MDLPIKSRVHMWYAISLFSFLGIYADNIQFITSAPTGAPNEPTYQDNRSNSVDWLSEPIANNYYVAALAPTMSDMETKTIGVYRFIPGNLPSQGELEFVASAPTGQCIFDPVTQQDVCDEIFNLVNQLNWFPHSMNGEYFFTVVGREGGIAREREEKCLRLGVPGKQTIRVYRFNPDNETPADGTIDFIDSAPLQASEGEPGFRNVMSVNWFPRLIDGMYYFAVCGATVDMNDPQVRVYSFDQTAPLGTNLSFVGAAANDVTNPRFTGAADSVSWLPELADSNSYFAVGGNDSNSPIRVYQFCTASCQGTDVSPNNNVRLIATAPNQSEWPVSIARAVEWLVANERYYLAVAVVEQHSLPGMRTPQLVRIYEFIPGKNDPTQGVLRFITSAPVKAVCCNSDLTDTLERVTTLDWLKKDGRFYLLVSKNTLFQFGVIVYQFDNQQNQLIFVTEKSLDTSVPLFSVNWFPGEIEGNCYFGVSLFMGEELISGTETKGPFEIFRFRPPCDFTALSCRSQKERLQ